MRRKVDHRQLDLFAPAALRAPSQLEERLQITQIGLYLGPTSAFTGGLLCAIEAVRVLRGWSIGLAGILYSETEIRCAACMRYGQISIVHHRPLFHAVSIRGQLPGARYKCTRCSQYFTAHRNEDG